MYAYPGAVDGKIKGQLQLLHQTDKHNKPLTPRDTNSADKTSHIDSFFIISQTPTQPTTPNPVSHSSPCCSPSIIPCFLFPHQGYQNLKKKKKTPNIQAQTFSSHLCVFFAPLWSQSRKSRMSCSLLHVACSDRCCVYHAHPAPTKEIEEVPWLFSDFRRRADCFLGAFLHRGLFMARYKAPFPKLLDKSSSWCQVPHLNKSCLLVFRL